MVLWSFRPNLQFDWRFGMSGARAWSCNTLMAGISHLATNSTGPQSAEMDIDAMIAESRQQKGEPI